MITTEPKVDPNGLYQMGDAAKALQIAPSTLHRYTEAGLVKPRVRRSNGRRVWKGIDLITLWRIIY